MNQAAKGRECFHAIKPLSSRITRLPASRAKRTGFWHDLVISLGLLLALTQQSCSRSPARPWQATVSPPFAANDQVVPKQAFLHISEPVGMTGDQLVFGMWQLQATEEQLHDATSNAQVLEKLYWISGQSDELKRVLKFFEAYEEYRSLMATNMDILNAADIRYAYVNLWVTKDDDIVRYATMWVCSPKAKKLLFLSGH